MPGIANIFLNNSFIANSNVNQVAPAEKLHIALGKDQNIKIEHLFINKFLKNEGFVSKRNKEYHQKKITIANLKRSNETIKIKDQIPISKHNDIIVNLIEPNIKDINSNVRKSEQAFLEWNLEIEAGEKIEIPIEYSIEYPKNDELTYTVDIKD